MNNFYFFQAPATETPKDFEGLADVFKNSLGTILQQIIDALPGLIFGIITLIIGYILAKVISWIVTKLLKALKVDELLEKLELKEFLEKANVKATVAKIMGKFVFWFIMLIFIMTATDLMGLSMVSLEIQKLIEFLPKILVAIIFFAVGFFIARFVRDMISGATKSMNMVVGRLISSFIFIFLMIVIALTSLKLLGIDTSLITSNILMIIGAMLLAAVISYSLSSKDVLSNILGGFFTRKTYPLGSEIEIDGLRGKIIENNNIGIVLDCGENGKHLIPNSELVRLRVKIFNK